MLVKRTIGKSGTNCTILRSMFEARKSVFVDLLGWDVPVIDDRYEMDQFDGDHATYLIITDNKGKHRASARLLPTTRPHLLGSIFANLCDGPVPTGPDIFEITRFCLDRHLDARERRFMRNRLVSALADHALEQNIGHYSGIAEPNWLRQIQGFGWACTQLGEFKTIFGRPLGALRIDISGSTIDALRVTGIYHDELAPHQTLREAA